MKYLPFLLLVSIFPLRAQPGIFLTAADYSKQQVTYTNVPGYAYRIRLNELLRSRYICITTGGNTYRFLKDSIYGYRDRFGYCYRFMGKIAYEILNPGELLLLYRLWNVNGKNEVPSLTHFFSRSPSGNIYPLKLSFIKTAFADEPLFLEWIGLYFQTDADLLRYDIIQRCYSLNRLLLLSKSVNTLLKTQ